ncbi:MAG: hypothetical protein H6Q89_170 [Myxococcaceae bacterium]|nr:hypothetical protein [Myxococcaceae bacterium]
MTRVSKLDTASPFSDAAITRITFSRSPSGTKANRSWPSTSGLLKLVMLVSARLKTTTLRSRFTTRISALACSSSSSRYLRTKVSSSISLAFRTATETWLASWISTRSSLTRSADSPAGYSTFTAPNSWPEATSGAQSPRTLPWKMSGISVGVSLTRSGGRPRVSRCVFSTADDLSQMTSRVPSRIRPSA